MLYSDWTEDVSCDNEIPLPRDADRVRQRSGDDDNNNKKKNEESGMEVVLNPGSSIFVPKQQSSA